MDRYEVYFYNIPRVTDDGKSEIPTPPSEKLEFDSFAEASRCAADRRGTFDRVVVMRLRDGAQKMVERFTDGRHETFAEGAETATA